MIKGFELYNINKYIDISESDINDYDIIIKSIDTLILIKKYNTEIELIENWREQLYFVGGYIQNNFEKLNLPTVYLWNTYIIYLVNFDVSSNIKILIETDKFSCKKYIINIRDNDDYEEVIVKSLPALTSLSFSNNLDDMIRDEKDIKKQYLEVNNIDEKLKNYIMHLNILDYENKSISILIDEMVGILDE